jgi:hypothetical protein
MPTPEGLAGRAEDLLIKLNHVMDARQSADTLSRIDTTRARAEQSKELLQSIVSVLPDLKRDGVAPPRLPETRVKELTDARRVLRSTATTVASVEAPEAATRVSSNSVSRSLDAAEKTGTWLLGHLNRTVDNARARLLPENIDDRVIAYPGVADSTFYALRRIQTTLRTPVNAVATPAQLVTRMTEIRQAVDYWNTHRPLLDQAEQAQHDDVRSFLDQAASDTGAPWTAITGVVREWLTDEDNADAIRIHLRS